MPTAGSGAIAWFEELRAAHPEVAARQMFGQPAAFVQGNLCFGVFGEELFLRLSEKDRAAAAAVAGTKPFEPMPGRAMTGYLVFPRSLRKDRAKFDPWVRRSIEYVESLPAKGPKAAKKSSPRRSP